jgi:hypothetical protein
MELLKEVLPNAARVAVIWNANDQGMTLRYREIEKAARALQLEVRPLEIRQPVDLDAVISTMAQQRPDAVFLVSDPLTAMNRKRIIEFATAQRIPSMYESNTYVRDGGLMSYGYSLEESFIEAARYIDRIFNGMKPADLPPCCHALLPDNQPQIGRCDRSHDPAFGADEERRGNAVSEAPPGRTESTRHLWGLRPGHRCTGKRAVGEMGDKSVQGHR